MTEKDVKHHLQEALELFTAGTILHLLSEVFRDEADEARLAGDSLAYRRSRNVEATLFVVGIGIDAARPR